MSAPTNFFSGKDGNFVIGNEAQFFSEWELEVDSIEFKTTNFQDAGFQNRIMGFINGSIKAKGPFDPTKTKPVRGTSGNMLLTVGTNFVFTVPAVVKTAKYSQNVESGAMVEISALSQGLFDFDLSS